MTVSIKSIFKNQLLKLTFETICEVRKVSMSSSQVSQLDTDSFGAPLENQRALLIRRILITVGISLLVLALAYWRSGGSGLLVTQAIVTGLLVGGVYSLIALGLTLIFGVLHIINFAQGALVTMGMYVTYVISSNYGWNPYLTLVISIPLLFAFGGLVQILIINRSMGEAHENQLLLTLALGLLIENTLLLVFGGNPLSVRTGTETIYNIFGAVATQSRVIAFAGAAFLALVLFIMLQRTAIGTAIRAVAANPTGARLVGINVKRIYIVTFAIGAACAGAAGTLVVPFVSITPIAGEIFNITAFVVVVLGGLGKVVGAMFGGLIVGLAEQFGGIFFPDQSNLLGVFAVFILILFLRPQGLFANAS
jgi:branched-chain amino acid transport system permease protein